MAKRTAAPDFLPNAFSGPRFEKNSTRAPKDKHPCGICGLPVSNAATLVRVINYRFVEAGVEPGPGDVDHGGWGIGSECLRRHPALQRVVQTYVDANARWEKLAASAATWIEGNAADKGVPSAAVLVWDFHEAPAALRALSDDGGDEDTLCLVPPAKATREAGVYARIADRLGGMGDGPSTFRVPTLLGEFHVLIFAHG